MASYIQRKNKTGTVYDVRFRIIDESGQEVNKRLCGFPTKKSAERAYIDFMKTYVPPAFTLKKGVAYIYDDLYAQYRAKQKAELAPSSFYDLNWITDKFITPCFTGKSLADLTKADYMTWQTNLWGLINEKTGTPLSQKYLTKVRSTLGAFLNWVEEVYDLPNKLNQLKKPRRKELKKEMQFWELSEFQQFESACDDCMWKTFFMLLFYSGARVGEILALGESDLIPKGDGYTLNISKGLTRKSNEDVSYIITAPKTSSSVRKVTLPDIMCRQIKTYLDYKRERNQSPTFLFGGDKPLRQRTYQRAFAKYTELAGIKHIRIHDLRHSHASMLIHLGVPITVISKRLGHSSVKMTLERYSHCYSGGEDEAIAALNYVTSIKKDGAAIADDTAE